MTTPPRRPAAFRIEPAPASPSETVPRKPKAIRDVTQIIVSDVDFYEAEAAELPPLPIGRRRWSWAARIFWSALGSLLAMALGLWVEGLIRDLFAQTVWLGWVGAALASALALALIVLVGREAIALSRLASFERLRKRGAAAFTANDAKAARAVISELSGLLASQPATAAGRKSLAALVDDVIDGSDLIHLAEMELLAPLDAMARSIVLDSAKRVSLVTAVSPRAIVDIAYVVFECGRLIRRISTLYGGRPGMLGFVRLTRDTIAHLAVTGTIAAGDSVVQQLIGQGLAARLSAKLGEGIINGMMTARIGVAAMDAVRPLDFNATRRPGIADFLTALTKFTAQDPNPKQ